MSISATCSAYIKTVCIRVICCVLHPRGCPSFAGERDCVDFFDDEKRSSPHASIFCSLCCHVTCPASGAGVGAALGGDAARDPVCVNVLYPGPCARDPGDIPLINGVSSSLSHQLGLARAAARAVR